MRKAVIFAQKLTMRWRGSGGKGRTATVTSE